MPSPRKFFDFAEFRDHALSLILAYYPTSASMLGLHEYDSRVEDFSARRREQYLDEIRTCLQTLERDFSHKSASPGTANDIARFECRMLDWKLRDEIFRLTEFREFEWNPMVYNDQLELNQLIDRDFASLPIRLRSVLARLQAYPRVLAIARQNLSLHLDRTIVETSIESLEGRLDYLSSLPKEFLGKLDDTLLEHDLMDALETARLAVQSFIEAVRTVVLPDSMYNSFRLGSDLLQRYLQSAELVDEPIAVLIEKGRREMDRLTLELYKASEELDPHYSPREVFHHYIETEHFSEQNILSE
ncbi:MAG TPA: DUF885 family protein, partial [Candidatus Kapabacteria bacterium]